MSKALKKIFFFDFDGTITKRDSFLLFSYFSISKLNFFRFWFKTSIKLIFTKKNRGELKQQFFIDNFKDFKEDDFQKICDDFYDKYFNYLIKPSFLNYVKKLNNNCKVVIVSASIKNYLKPWCDKLNFDLICTELDVKKSKLTGCFSTPNCNYKEKVVRIKENYNLDEYDTIYVFGDTNGDRDMMSITTNKFYKYFK